MAHKDVPNVFLSWSGSLSCEVATQLREWLPLVVNDVLPWMSSEDIAKGSVWASKIMHQLNTCKIGVVVLTRENLTAPWVLFEAGAIFKAMNDCLVCTVLCDITKTSVPLPLGQFQATELNRDDVLKLCKDVYEALAAGPVDDRIQRRFDKLWPQFEEACDRAMDRHAAKEEEPPTEPSESVMLEEILTTTSVLT